MEKEESNKDFFELHFKYIAIIPVLLTITGAVKLQIVYQNFGVNITSYLELSEVLLSYLDDLPTITGLIFFISYVSDLLESAYGRLEKIFQKQSFYLILPFPLIIILILYTFIILHRTTSSEMFTTKLGIHTSAIIILSAFLAKLPNFMPKELSIDFTMLRVTRNYLVVIFIMLYYTVNTANIRIMTIKKKLNTGSYFLTDKKKYLVDSKTLYLGSSKNYHFLYNEPGSYAVIIPNSEVKETLLKPSRALNLFEYFGLM